MGLFNNKKEKKIQVTPGKMVNAPTPPTEEMQELQPLEPGERLQELQTSNPNEQPSDQPNEQPSDQTNEQPSDQPNEQPSDQTNEQPSDQPNEQSSNQRNEQLNQPTSEHTAPLPILDIPDEVFQRVSSGTTIQDSIDYISILLKEVEAVRQENAQLRISKQDRNNAWKALSVVLSFVIIAGMVGFLLFYTFLYRKAVQTAGISFAPTESPSLTPDAGLQNATVFLLSDLTSYVETLDKDVIKPFHASVEDCYGYEALCLSAGNIKLYYRNEFEPKEEEKRRVVIDNGSVRTEFEWDYVLGGDIREMVPGMGAFAQDGTEQLVFVKYHSEYHQFPKYLRFVEKNNLSLCGDINTESALKNAFTTTYEEQVGQSGTESDKLMTVRFKEASYRFRIPTDAYINAVLYEENILKFAEHFELIIDEKGLSFRTVLTLGEKECLGELTGILARSNLQFAFTNLIFGAYAEADQEDVTSDGIIDPRQNPLSDYIVINGRKKERFLIPISDEIEPSVMDWEAWNEILPEDGKNGWYQYVPKNEIASIHGIDVSKYQGEIDWEKVKASGVEFAMIRLGYRGMTEGTLELDPSYENNIKNANAAGVKVGIYFFSQAKNTQEAKEEAAFVLENIKDNTVTYPIVFDTEEVVTYDARANGLSRTERTDCCIAFCQAVKEAGYTPMIYANTRYMIMGLELERLNDYDKWFAYYGTKSTFPYKFTMLQYADTGTVDGIDGPVDLDISFVDYSQKTAQE